MGWEVKGMLRRQNMLGDGMESSILNIAQRGVSLLCVVGPVSCYGETVVIQVMP